MPDPDKSFCGVEHENLYLVRVQDRLDGMEMKDGHLVMNRSHWGNAEARNTFHFTLNALVRDHTYGKGWNDSPYVVISPLQRVCHETSHKPAGISPADTYFHADSEGCLRLPGAIMVVPQGTPLPHGLSDENVFFYPRGNTKDEMRQNRDRAVSRILEQNEAPYLSVGGDGWINPDGTETHADHNEINNIKRDFAGGHECYVSRHSLNPDGRMEDDISLIREMIVGYCKGERLHTHYGSGREESLYVVMQERLQDMDRFLQERQTHNAHPDALAFYDRQIKNIKQEMADKTREPRLQELDTHLYEQYYVHDGITLSEPLSMKKLLTLFEEGKIQPQTATWRAGMKEWGPLENLPEYKDIQEIRALRSAIKDTNLTNDKKPILASAIPV